MCLYSIKSIRHLQCQSFKCWIHSRERKEIQQNRIILQQQREREREELANVQLCNITLYNKYKFSSAQ